MNSDNKIYEMNLFKKTTYTKSSDNTVVMPYFWVMGHFDLMSVNIIDKFSNILEYYEPKEISGKKYMKYSMYIYDPSCESAGGENCPECDENANGFKLLDTEYTKDNIFLISALKINLHKDIQAYYLDGNRDWFNDGNMFFCMIKNKIKEIQQNNEIFKDVHIEVYVCTGSFDVVTVASTKTFDSNFCNFATSLWDIMYTEKSAGGKDIPIFLSVNSFVVVGNNYCLDNIKAPNAELFDISIRHSLNTMKHYDDIVDNYKKIFTNDDGVDENKDFGAPLIFGEHDLSIFVNNCSLEKLLYINGVRNYKEDVGSSSASPPLIDGDLLKAYEKNQEDIIMSYTQIKYKRIYLPQNVKNPDIGQIGENGAKVNEIKKLYAEIGNCIPVGCERILKLLISKCVYMLETRHRRIAGFRMYRIIKTILCHIKSEGEAGKKGLDNTDYVNYLNNCIGNIIMTIDVVMQSDNIQLDFIDDDDIQTLNPSTKFMYAYEYILATLFRFLDKREGEPPLIMLSMNPTKFISSYRYTRNTNDIADIIEINIPNAEYFNPDQWPYMVHELAHYLKMTKKKNTVRNKVFIEMVNDYLILNMMENNEEIVQASNARTKETMELLVQVLYSYNLFDYKEEPSDFIENCKKYIKTLYEKLNDITNNVMSFRQYKWICDELNVIIANEYIIFYIFKELIREARADMIMWEVCEMDIPQYIMMMQKQCNLQESLSIHEPYQIYGLRMLAVLLAVCGKNIDVLLREIYALDKKFKDFIIPFIEKTRNYTEFLSNLCDYLIMIRENVKMSINENRKAVHLRKIFIDSPKFSRENQEKSIYHTIVQLMNQWYNSLYYMEE